MDEGGRRCGSALLDAIPVAAAVVVVVLIENERGWVGGAVRPMLAPPASLSSLSLEGGGEAVLLKRCKTPLVTGVELLAVPAVSPIGRLFPVDVDALGSDSA